MYLVRIRLLPKVHREEEPGEREVADEKEETFMVKVWWEGSWTFLLELIKVNYLISMII